MMKLNGRVVNGQILLDSPKELPEGARVSVILQEEPKGSDPESALEEDMKAEGLLSYHPRADSSESFLAYSPVSIQGGPISQTISEERECPIEKIRMSLNPQGEIRLIPGAPEYAVSDQGEIFSLKSAVPRRVKTQIGKKDGYVHYKIQGPGKQIGGVVHRLVAEIFVPRDPGAGDIVRHIDGNRTNNIASNLVWGSSAENMKDRDGHGRNPWGGSRHPNAKLSESDVVEIRKQLKSNVNVVEIAKKFGVSSGTIVSIRDGRSWQGVQ